jgi:hypothetical protein
MRKDWTQQFLFHMDGERDDEKLTLVCNVNTADLRRVVVGSFVPLRVVEIRKTKTEVIK